MEIVYKALKTFTIHTNTYWSTNMDIAIYSFKEVLNQMY